MDNILQVLMDGPSVNWKFYDSITIDREQSELSELINIGSCGLYVLYGVLKTGVDAAGWEIRTCSMDFFSCFMILLLGSQITSKLHVVLLNKNI